MCGIAGIVAPYPGTDVSPLIERLTAALAHRGPDGSGVYYARGRSIALGHRRLSIVDVEGGAQPMANEDETVWVVFNGELYNHLEIRRELETLGHRFRTRAAMVRCAANYPDQRASTAPATPEREVRAERKTQRQQRFVSKIRCRSPGSRETRPSRCREMPRRHFHLARKPRPGMLTREVRAIVDRSEYPV